MVSEANESDGPQEPEDIDWGEMVARLVFTYRIDPERVMHIPRPYLLALVQWMPVLESEKALMQMQASAYPHLKKSHRQRLWNKLKRPVRRSKAVVLDRGGQVTKWLANQDQPLGG